MSGSDLRSLTDGSIRRGMPRFALPILLTNVLQPLGLSVNSILIGLYLGEAALAASSNANVLMFLLIGAAFGLAIAATILVGRCIGAGDIREAKRIVGTSATFFATLSTGLLILVQAFLKPLLVSLGTPADSLPLALQYMRVISLALPLMYMYSFVMSVLRGAGDSKTPLYFTLLSVAVDIALNPVLIFGLGPVPRLGIAGSALATLLAQAISLTALVSYLYRRGQLLCIDKDELWMLRVDWTLIGTLVRKGIPLCGHVLVLTLSSVLMIVLVNRFGVDTTAAFGASIQLWNYIQMPAIAVSAAVTTMAAQNVGARKWSRVTSIAAVGVVYGVVLTGSIALAMEILDTRAFGLFVSAGSNALPIASHINRIATWSFVFYSISSVLFGVVRATGAVLVPLGILVAVLAVRFPVTEALLDRWHADAIWWSYPISSVLTAGLAALYYKYGGWRTPRLEL